MKTVSTSVWKLLRQSNPLRRDIISLLQLAGWIEGILLFQAAVLLGSNHVVITCWWPDRFTVLEGILSYRVFWWDFMSASLSFYCFQCILVWKQMTMSMQWSDTRNQKLQCCTIIFIFQQTQRHKHLSAGNQIAWALYLLHLNRMGALDQIALLLLLLVAFVACISTGKDTETVYTFAVDQTWILFLVSYLP